MPPFPAPTRPMPASLRLLLLAALVGGSAACARANSTGFPPPARPGFLVPTDEETTFAALAGLLDSRGFPVLLTDMDFGTLITDWIEWGPGDANFRTIADCGLDEKSPAYETRGRFAFEVRPRANRAFVTILTHFQVQRYAGFDDSDRGWVDCRSTGEWERNVAEALTQQQRVVR